MLLGKTTLHGSQERLLQRHEIPIAGPGDCAQLFQDGPLAGTNAFLGENRLDAVFDSPKRAEDGGSILGPPHEENFRLMPAKNQIVKIDHLFPCKASRSYHPCQTGRRSLLLGGSRLYWHNDQRTFKASQNSCKRVLARDQVLGACALRAQENVVSSALGRLLEELVSEEPGDDGGSDFNAGTLERFGKGV